MRLARDIMFPKLSIYLKERGEDLLKKLLVPYPGLPVVNDMDRVVGIISDIDVLLQIKNGWTIRGFIAERIMTCGHEEHELACPEPVVATPEMDLAEVLALTCEKRVSIIPVVEKKEDKKLLGLITRKSLIMALNEKHFWPEHEYITYP